MERSGSGWRAPVSCKTDSVFKTESVWPLRGPVRGWNAPPIESVVRSTRGRKTNSVFKTELVSLNVQRLS